MDLHLAGLLVGLAGVVVAIAAAWLAHHDAQDMTILIRSMAR